MVSLCVVGLNLTTCHRRFGGSPRIRAFDSSSSFIPTNRASLDISSIYFSAYSEFINFLFSKRIVFKVVRLKLFSQTVNFFLVSSVNARNQHFADCANLFRISIVFLYFYIIQFTVIVE